MKTETEKLESSLGFAVALLSIAGLWIVGTLVYQVLSGLLILVDSFVNF